MIQPDGVKPYGISLIQPDMTQLEGYSLMGYSLMANGMPGIFVLKGTTASFFSIVLQPIFLSR